MQGWELGEELGMSGGQRAGWLAVSMASHLAWGLYPVFGRVLQHQRGLDGLACLAIAQSLADSPSKSTHEGGE